MALIAVIDDTKHFYDYDDEKYVTFQSMESFIEFTEALAERILMDATLIDALQLFDEVHLDHDLGYGKNGMWLLNQMEELRDKEPTVYLPKITIITQNPSMRPVMEKVAAKLNGETK